MFVDAAPWVAGGFRGVGADLQLSVVAVVNNLLLDWAEGAPFVCRRKEKQREWLEFVVEQQEQDTLHFRLGGELPYHPLFEAGYATVGDWHSSRPVTTDDAHERDTRFGGLKQECGLHLDEDQAASLDSSGL